MCGKETDASWGIAISRLRPAAAGNGFDHVWMKWNPSKHTSKQCIPHLTTKPHASNW